jgi:hypothetical protein
MARKIIHQLVDDLDGTVLEPGEGQSVQFALDGRGYEIDLTDANATQLREFLAPYIGAGRRTIGSVVSAKPARARGTGSGRDQQQVREWARENGHTVSDRGRIPQTILDAYDAAH